MTNIDRNTLAVVLFSISAVLFGLALIEYLIDNSATTYLYNSLAVAISFLAAWITPKNNKEGAGE